MDPGEESMNELLRKRARYLLADTLQEPVLFFDKKQCNGGLSVKARFRELKCKDRDLPPGARTLDPNIKSVVLYQLS